MGRRCSLLPCAIVLGLSLLYSITTPQGRRTRGHYMVGSGHLVIYRVFEETTYNANKFQLDCPTFNVFQSYMPTPSHDTTRYNTRKPSLISAQRTRTRLDRYRQGELSPVHGELNAGIYGGLGDRQRLVHHRRGLDSTRWSRQ
jgi:hypothetical protein